MNTKINKEIKEAPPVWFPIIPVMILTGIGIVSFGSYKLFLWLGIPINLPIPFVLRIILGVPLVLMGCFFFIWGFGLLKPAGALGLAKRLRTSGAYAYTRNPMYFGVCTVFWGTGILLSLSYVFVAALIWSVFNYCWVVLGEEKEVEEKFGEEYLEYKKRVPRFIPSMKNKKLFYGILIIVLAIMGISLFILSKPTTTLTSEDKIIVKQSGGMGILIAECADKNYIAETADYIIEGTVEATEITATFTYTDLRIKKYIKGAPFAEDKLQIVTPGETFGVIGLEEDQPLSHKTKKLKIYLQKTNNEFSLVCAQFGVEEVNE